MDASLRAAEVRLEQLLGWAGVHAVGVDEADRCFEVRVDATSDVALAAIRESAEEAARPFPVTVVSSPSPSYL